MVDAPLISLPMEPAPAPKPTPAPEPIKISPEDEAKQIREFIGDRRFAIAIHEAEINQGLTRLNELRNEKIAQEQKPVAQA